MLKAPTSLQALVLVLLVFGVAPGLALRFMTLAFHRDDPRRDELRAELHVVPTLEWPVWVAQQLETVIFDGLRDRIEWVLTGRLIHRWELGNGVENNQRWPDTFWIPSDEEKAEVDVGTRVKVAFQMRQGYGEQDGWGERMWVDVTEVKGDRFIGELFSQPVGIPKLESGHRIGFTADHIIDISEHRANSE